MNGASVAESQGESKTCVSTFNIKLQQNETMQRPQINNVGCFTMFLSLLIVDWMFKKNVFILFH